MLSNLVAIAILSQVLQQPVFSMCASLLAFPIANCVSFKELVIIYEMYTLVVLALALPSMIGNYSIGIEIASSIPTTSTAQTLKTNVPLFFNIGYFAIGVPLFISEGFAMAVVAKFLSRLSISRRLLRGKLDVVRT